LAQFYNKFGKYSQSAEVFSTMVENEPNVRENYVEAASQYFNAKSYDKSIVILKKMQTAFGIEMESSSRLEYVYTATNQTDKAIEEMEKLVAEDPSEIRYRGFLAETYLNAGEKDKAISTLNEVIKMEPTTGKAYFALFGVYSDDGNVKLAAENLKKAFEYDDVSLQQKMQASSLYFNALTRGDEQAKTLLVELSDILVDEYPNQVEPLMLKGDIYGVIGYYSKARAYNREALKIKASD
jgi:tetratricopeptide (TPR) repeat protein